ncbi:hypothetical protein GCM10007108_16990 [Thermogymnomonas acidicola]|uniref:DUF1059 domain-containing protein n=1 Tax=Thermogymnomonas acidicola TaxID=399579 RepID=A0AA37BSS4_9ARCH|nr:DUF1059 domain-containing protein [Thermogymnomonas acidicola]GGM79345.1 hypothetical protein GCM10007108_16990 [Thermogymnomonas acidicola]
MKRYHYRCADTGRECSFEYDAGKPEDLLPRIRMHERYAHGHYEIPEDLMAKIKSAFTEYEKEEAKT